MSRFGNFGRFESFNPTVAVVYKYKTPAVVIGIACFIELRGRREKKVEGEGSLRISIL